MGKHLNPLEKEFLIRQYKSNPRLKMGDFCETNSISVGAFQKWMKQYNEWGLEGLARADSEIREILPEGIDRTEEFEIVELLARDYDIQDLCQLMGVSRSGYYKWKKRSKSRRDMKREEVISLVDEIHKAHPSHGYRWVAAYLRINHG